MRKISSHRREEKFKAGDWRLDKGFTLIELLIALAIVGILATIGLNSFSSSQKRARDAKRKADLDQLQKGLELYQQDQSPIRYPPASDYADLRSYLTDYMSTFPSPPKVLSGEAYFYTCPRLAGDNLTYLLYACLENEDDTDRDDVDGGANDLCGESGYVSYSITEP